MKVQSGKLTFHISYWLFVLLTLTIIFGRSWGNPLAAFFFIAMLLPIVLGTSYFFNYFLVPFYFIKKEYFQFGLYCFYTIVISLYLEIIVLMFSFAYLANFNFKNLAPNAADTILLAVVLYLLVFVGSFILMARQIRENQGTIHSLLEEKEKAEKGFLEVMSNRKMVQIPFEEITYLESMADYIQIHSSTEVIISKEKISKILERLPSNFLRIHRSFIINKDKLKAWTYNEVQLEEIELNIGRSYKKDVREQLGSR
ncbi:MAG: LytTR family DNA-binding domain-containing protein [Saprospiraceae bacterium]